MAAPPSTAFRVDWLSPQELGCSGALGVCGLPGAKRGPFNARTERDMPEDLATLAAANVTDVVSMTTDEELRRNKCTQLHAEMRALGWTVHLAPLGDGEAPAAELTARLVKLLDDLLQQPGKRVVLQCKAGIGRACTLAALYLQVAPCALSADAAVDRVRALRGPAAIQTVRQFNCVMEYAPGKGR